MLLKRPDALRFVRYISERGFSTLGAACLRDAPLETVNAILDMSPKLVTQQDRSGLTPLHTSIQHASESTIALILEKAPFAASIANNAGLLPLHTAISCRRSPFVIEKLLLAYPSAVQRKYPHSNESIINDFVLCWNGFAERVCLRRSLYDKHEMNEYVRSALKFEGTLSLLLRAYVCGTTDEEKIDWIFSHELIRRNIPIPSVFRDQILRSPACERPDRQGDFPLHIACMRQSYEAR